MINVRAALERSRPGIIVVGLITAAQGFVATLMTEGPTAPAIMLAGLIVVAMALVPGARRPGS